MKHLIEQQEATIKELKSIINIMLHKAVRFDGVMYQCPFCMSYSREQGNVEHLPTCVVSRAKEALK